MKYLIAVLAIIASVACGDVWSGSLDEKVWKLNYTIDSTAATFAATVWCKTKGWIGMALSYDGPSGHVNSDSMVAFAINGTGYIHDQFSNTHEQPSLDTTLGGKEDLTMTGWGSDATSNWVTFWRKLNTGDAKYDIVIQNKDVNVAWACGTDVPTIKPDGTIDYNMHPDGHFGATKVNLFMATPPMSTSSMAPPKSSMMATSWPASTSKTATSSGAVAAIGSWLLMALAALPLVAFV